MNSWPVHCIAESYGSDFHPSIGLINKNDFEHIFYKGYGQADYSGFQGRSRHGHGPELGAYLDSYGVKEVDICGLAGDYCVKETALSAVSRGYKTEVLSSLVASVHGAAGTKAALEAVETFKESLGS